MSIFLSVTHNKEGIKRKWRDKMNWICPICNGLSTFLLRCPHCGHQMESIGRMQDFLGEYSPYLSMEITDRMDNLPSTQCLHIFCCEFCNYDKRAVVHKVQI